MDRPVQTVRLIGVVLMSLAAVLFVHEYSKWLYMRLDTLQGVDLSAACEFLLDYGWTGIALPFFAAVFGACTIANQRRVVHEIILVLASVLTVSWVLFAILAWEIVKIPII